MPAQRRPGGDQRDEIAGPQLALQELVERHLGPVAFGLGEVDVVEEQHEGPAGDGLDPGVGAEGVAARGDGAGGRRRRRIDRDGLEQRDRLRAPFVPDLEIGRREVRHRLAGLVHDDGIDDDEVGAGPEGRLIGGRLLLRHDGGRQHRRAGQRDGRRGRRSAAVISSSIQPTARW